MSETYELKTIGHVRATFPKKFGIRARRDSRCARIRDNLRAGIPARGGPRGAGWLLPHLGDMAVLRGRARAAGRRRCGRRVSAATRAWAYLRRAHPSARMRWGFPACGLSALSTARSTARICALPGQICSTEHRSTTSSPMSPMPTAIPRHSPALRRTRDGASGGVFGRYAERRTGG